jgi:hypothetical protein
MRSEVRDWESNMIRCLMQDRPQTLPVMWRTMEWSAQMRRRGNVVEDSLVNVTRPGYNTLSRSFSDEIPSTPFSPSGVAVDRAGAEGGEDETPSRVNREARVGLGRPSLPTGRRPGDAGLVRESSYSRHLSGMIRGKQKGGPNNLGLQDLLGELQGCELV